MEKGQTHSLNATFPTANAKVCHYFVTTVQAHYILFEMLAFAIQLKLTSQVVFDVDEDSFTMSTDRF